MLLATLDPDVPSLLAALRRLGWSLDDLAAGAKLDPEHVAAIVAGRTFAPHSVRRMIEAVNGALERRGTS